MIERLQEHLAVTIRENDRGFFRETDLVHGDHLSLTDAQFVLVDLLDDDGGIGEGFRQADTTLRVRGSRF